MPTIGNDTVPSVPRDAIRVTTRNDPFDPGHELQGFGLRAHVRLPVLPVVRINAPDFFKDPEIRTWLNDPQRAPATWHRGGEPGENSDSFVYYGGAGWTERGEFHGDGSDFPGTDQTPGLRERHYALIARAVELATGSSSTECLVWLTNLDADD